jgi:hypothetical protein
MYLLGRPKFRGDEDIAPADILKNYSIFYICNVKSLVMPFENIFLGIPDSLMASPICISLRYTEAVSIALAP